MRQFAVIGLGRFGLSVSKTLTQKDGQVLVIDKDEDKIQDISDSVSQAVCLDATDADALKAVGIEQVDVAIVSVGDDIEASILITLLLKELGIKEIITKAVTPQQGKVLEKIGANKIIFPERDMGIRLANVLTSPKVTDYLQLSNNCSIVELKAPKSFIGRTLKQLNVRAKYKLNVVAIKRKNKQGEESINAGPFAEEKIETDDSLLIAGDNEDIDKLKKEE
ncbi:MAG: TrkA family potassium uptake protein [Candidatus Omnitrophica bacterium]|nr:TrkA family potassium uptake protein [Candidatus Omnitrophota bacterium]